MSSQKNNGLRLKVLRVQSGIKAINVAARLGWNPSKLSLIENGHIGTDKQTVAKIEQAIVALRDRNGGSDAYG